jgi:hypothetical protein
MITHTLYLRTSSSSKKTSVIRFEVIYCRKALCLRRSRAYCSDGKANCLFSFLLGNRILDLRTARGRNNVKTPSQPTDFIVRMSNQWRAQEFPVGGILSDGEVGTKSRQGNKSSTW